MKHRRHLRIAASTLILLTALVFLAGLIIDRLIPTYINLKALKYKIETAIEQTTGIRAKIQTLEIHPTLFHGVKVLFNNNVLFDPADIKVVKAGQVEVNVRYWPLIWHRKTSISRVAFSDIKVYIGENSFLFRIKPPKVPSTEVFLKDAQLSLENYDVIIDRYFDSVNQYALHGHFLTLNHFKSHVPLELVGTGHGDFENNGVKKPIGDLNLLIRAPQSLVDHPRFNWEDPEKIDFEFSHLDLQTLATIMRSYGLPVKASGQVRQLVFELTEKDFPKMMRIEGSTQKNVPFEFGQYHFVFTPGRLLAKAQLRANRQGQLEALRHLLISLHSRSYHFLLGGNIHLSQQLENSLLDLHAQSGWLPISSLNVAPHLLPPKVHYLLGLINGKFSTSFGLVGRAIHPAVTGTVRFSQVGINSPKKRIPLAKNINGTVQLNASKQVMIQRTVGYIANGPFMLNALLDLKKQTIKGSLGTARIHLGPLQEIIELLLGQPAQFAGHLSGEIGGHFQAQGPLKAPRIYGDLKLNQVSMTHQAQHPLNLLKNLNGGLHFEGRAIQFRNLQGWMPNGPVLITGWVFPDKNLVNLFVGFNNISLQALQMSLQDSLAWIDRSIPWLNETQMTGTLSGQAHVYGLAQKPAADGTLTISNGKVSLPQKTLVMHSISGAIQFKHFSMILPQLSANLQGIPLVASGSLNPRLDEINLDLEARHTDLSHLSDIIKLLMPQFANLFTANGAANIGLQLRGHLKNPTITGAIDFMGNQLTYLPKQISLTNIQGRLEMNPVAYLLHNIQGLAQGIPVTLNGEIRKQFEGYQIVLTSRNVPVQTVLQAIEAYEPAWLEPLKQLAFHSGWVDLNLEIADSLPNKVGGHITLRNATLTPSRLGMPVAVKSIEYHLETGQLKTSPWGIKVAGIPFTANGTATKAGYRVHVESAKIPITFVRDHRRQLMSLLSMAVPEIYTAQGALKLSALLTNTENTLGIEFLNAGASLPSLKFPLYDINGLVKLTLAKEIKAYSDQLTFRYGNSPMKLMFDINGLKDIYLEASGTLSPLLINDWLLSNSSSTLAYLAVPFDINLSGKLNKLYGDGAGNNLHAFLNVNVASLFTNPALENPRETGDVSLNEANLSSVLHLQGNTLKVEQTRFKVGSDGSVLLSGLIQDLFDPGRRKMSLSLDTAPDLNLRSVAAQLGTKIVGQLAGTVGAHVIFSNEGNQLMTKGDVTLNHVKSSALELDDLQGKILLEGTKGFLDIQHIQIPGINVGFTASIDDLSRYPLPISNFHMAGQQFIVSLYTEWISDVIVGRLKQGMWEQFFPNTGRLGILPFEIKSGTLDIVEGIINNLIVTNYHSNIRVYPTTYFELDNAYAHSAGGTVTGSFAMSPRNNNFMMAHLNIDKMKANAVARILLNVTNEIFGDLSGTIDFTTEGTTTDSLLSNTNGSANLRIDNGRLPTIAKAENLFLAANTISGGLANLDFNNLFHLLTPFKTEYFARLTGTFKMVDGIIYTDDMTSKGKNMDLVVSGWIRMVDGYANLLVRGQADQKLGGALGPLGNLSIGRFLGIFPPLSKIVGVVPGVGFIPGFGGPHGGKGLAFEVKIQGPAEDPASIKDFHWVK